MQLVSQFSSLQGNVEVRGLNEPVGLGAQEFQQVVEVDGVVDRLADLTEYIQFAYTPFQRFDHLGALDRNRHLAHQALDKDQFLMSVLTCA